MKQLYANYQKPLCFEGIRGMRKLFVFVFAFALCGVAGAAPSIDVLSDADESLYTQIFMLQDGEKISTAQNLERQLSDTILKNEIFIGIVFINVFI